MYIFTYICACASGVCVCVCVCVDTQAAHNELKTSNHRFLINIADAARRSRFNYISSKNTMRKQNPIVDVYR